MRQIVSLTVSGSGVVLVRARRGIGLPGPIATIVGFAAVPALAAGFKRSRLRDAAVWGIHMWAYKNAFEIPNDDHQRLRRRTHFDHPRLADARLGGGLPPTQRIQRRLRRRGRLTGLDKALSFFYWTWEAEPHLAMMWIRRNHPDQFAAAAGRLGATFDLTLAGYWTVPTAPPWWVSEKLGRLGEHYVTDELAGLVLALAVDRAERPLERLAGAVLSLGSGG